MSLANCEWLQILDLRHNGFIGGLPSIFRNLYYNQLVVLNLGYNNLHGSSPQWITHFTKLFLLDLSNNRFNGRIPYDLERLQGYAIYFSNQYHYSFEIKHEIYVS